MQSPGRGPPCPGLGAVLTGCVTLGHLLILSVSLVSLPSIGGDNDSIDPKDCSEKRVRFTTLNTYTVPGTQ